MKKGPILITVFTAALNLISAQSGMSGEILYFEGDVTVSRRGEILPDYEVDMGMYLEEEDVVRTGADGYLEIDLTYPRSGSHLKIQPDTVFYFDSRNQNGSQAARVNLITGTIGLKVSKLAKNESLNVETQNAVMGIRGTEFDVNKAPTGEILVTCEEGKVSCASPAMETFSVPGTVCLQEGGRDFADDSVPVSQLDNYRQKWWNARTEALVSMGSPAVAFYMERYKKQLPQFEEALTGIMANERLFREYESLLDRGEKPAVSKVTRDKITLSAPIIKMRSALPLMEEIFYTLLMLEEYQKRGYYNEDPRTFRDFGRRESSLEREIIKARYYLNLYAKISGAGDPFGNSGGNSRNSTMDSLMESRPF